MYYIRDYKVYECEIEKVIKNGSSAWVKSNDGTTTLVSAIKLFDTLEDAEKEVARLTYNKKQKYNKFIPSSKYDRRVKKGKYIIDFEKDLQEMLWRMKEQRDVKGILPIMITVRDNDFDVVRRYYKVFDHSDVNMTHYDRFIHKFFSDKEYRDALLQSCDD